MSACTAFAGPNRIASGEKAQVALAVKAVVAGGESAAILIFDNATSRLVEFDLRGTDQDVIARLEPEAPGAESEPPARGPGRPKLGVVSREVTLLPRHWDWLNAQPGGASVAIRKLVEAARKAGAGQDLVRQAQEAADRFMLAMAGNEPGYEDAARALYAGDAGKFAAITVGWPADVRDHAQMLAKAAFEPAAAVESVAD
jgi:hypothetical protein